MRILLTNDDGINAPGLKVLEEIARALSDDVWIVAPEHDQSGMAHSLTLHDPLRLRQIDEKRFALKGTPTDCAIMGIGHVLPARPDLILSGVNRGQNMGEDVTYSGTVAGAMEGAMLGIRSMALSQTHDWSSKKGIDWSCSQTLGASVVKQLLDSDLPPQTFFNINFPACSSDEAKGIAFTRQGCRDHPGLSVEPRVDTRGLSYFWFGFEDRPFEPVEGTDLCAIKNNQISVSPLNQDMTDVNTLSKLKG